MVKNATCCARCTHWKGSQTIACRMSQVPCMMLWLGGWSSTDHIEAEDGPHQALGGSGLELVNGPADQMQLCVMTDQSLHKAPGGKQACGVPQGALLHGDSLLESLVDVGHDREHGGMCDDGQPHCAGRMQPA
jgi:hypothetical protein